MILTFGDVTFKPKGIEHASIRDTDSQQTLFVEWGVLETEVDPPKHHVDVNNGLHPLP